MCNDKYNGWRNWETWNCNLWFDNFFVEDAQNIWDNIDDIYSTNLIDEQKVAGALASLIEDTVRELTTQNIPDSGFAADIIGQALQAIDFREIAEHYIEDVVSEEVYS